MQFFVARFVGKDSIYIGKRSSFIRTMHWSLQKHFPNEKIQGAKERNVGAPVLLDLSVSYSHLFPNFKIFLYEKIFSLNDQEIASAEDYFKHLAENYFTYVWKNCFAFKLREGYTRNFIQISYYFIYRSETFKST